MKYMNVRRIMKGSAISSGSRELYAYGVQARKPKLREVSL